MMFLSFINTLSVQSPVSYERTVSYREIAAGMYSTLPFALASCLVEVPYILLQVSMWRFLLETTCKNTLPKSESCSSKLYKQFSRVRQIASGSNAVKVDGSDSAALSVRDPCLESLEACQ